MIRRTRKIWTGIGVASFVGLTGAMPAAAQDSHKHTPATPPGKEADSGKMAAPAAGEAYLTDGGPKDTRIRVYRDIGLMRGHLRVGDELVELGEWDEAMPHFLHPTEELYVLMERYIKLHKVPPFDNELKSLAQAVKARNKPAYDRAARAVDRGLTATLTSFKRYMTGHPPSAWATRTMVEMLNVARIEYEASLEGDKFVNAMEYHDSRGFVWFVARLLDEHADEIARIDKARLVEMRRVLAELKKTWPTAMLPDKPVTDVATVAAHVEAFERAAEPFHKGRIP